MDNVQDPCDLQNNKFSNNLVVEAYLRFKQIVCCMSFILIWFEVLINDILFVRAYFFFSVVHRAITNMFVFVVTPSCLFLLSSRTNGDKSKF